MIPFMPGALYDDFNERSELAILVQRRALEDDLRELQERNREVLRRKRRRLVVEQLQHIHKLVERLQESKHNQQLEAKAEHAAFLVNCEGHESSRDWMLRRLIEQNEEIHAMIRKQLSTPSSSNCSGSSYMATYAKGGNEVDYSISIASPAKKLSITKDVSPAVGTVTHELPRESETVDSLPVVEWTDYEEDLLQKLLCGASGASVAPTEELGDARTVQIDEGNLPILLRKNQLEKQDRQQSRRRIVQLLNTSAISNTADIRRPRWRIEKDISDGIIRPFGEGAVVEQPMPLRQVFRSVFVVVLTVVEFKRLLYKKKLRWREKSIQDLKPMFEIYFDATRAWLGKAVKIPLLSILHEPGLDIDVRTKGGLFRASKGISKLFGRAASVAVLSNVTATECTKLVKLKVRVKGVIDGIVRDIEKDDMPNGIQDFLKRLTSNGIYFPSTYPLFATETQALELDPLGATQFMQSDWTSLQGRSYSRFQIVVINFIVVRILIPFVILRPWDVGISRGIPPRGVMANLKNVASVLYMIAFRLTPLPPITEGELGGSRRSIQQVAPVLTSHEDSFVTMDASCKSAENAGGREGFLDLSEIQRLLIPEKSLPVRQLEAFIDEQQQRIKASVAMLRGRIHPANWGLKEGQTEVQ